VIHYHGGPFSKAELAECAWRRRHALVSFARPEQIRVAAEVSQSFALDNGAFSMWTRGARPDWDKYYRWVDDWCRHPGCDFALIPDRVTGGEVANDELLKQWPLLPALGVPVWHLHESLKRLRRLSAEWNRVAIGSSGRYLYPGTDDWWKRMASVMATVCDDAGRPRVKLHGLRMLNPEVFMQLPLASADSTNVCRNIQLDTKWHGTYSPKSKRVRVYVLLDRIEAFNSAPCWEKRRSVERE
jgi:hypothetical protein